MELQRLGDYYIMRGLHLLKGGVDRSKDQTRILRRAPTTLRINGSNSVPEPLDQFTTNQSIDKDTLPPNNPQEMIYKLRGYAHDVNRVPALFTHCANCPIGNPALLDMYIHPPNPPPAGGTNYIHMHTLAYQYS